MHATAIRTLTLLALLAHGPATPAAVSPRQKEGYETVRVSGRVWAFHPAELGIGNSVAIVGDAGVIVVDSGLPAGARSVIAALAAVTSLPVTHLINTHWHDDHVWGNQVFAAAFPGLQILAHPDTRTDLLEQAVPALAGNIERLGATLAQRDGLLESGREADGNPISEDRRVELEARQAAFRQALDDLRSIEPTPPESAVERHHTLRDGDLRVDVRFLGRGHTRGDLVVHLPGENVVITGDLLVHPFPAAAEAWIDEWPATLSAIAALRPMALVPGHGPVLHDLAFLETSRELLQTVMDQVVQSIDAGMDLDTILERVDVSGHRARLAGDDPRLQAGFDRFFRRPAIESAWARARSQTR